MTRRQRYEGIIAYFETNVPEPRPELKYDSPFELLCAVMLSAQCTDKRVNMVTPSLFSHWDSPQELSKASLQEVKEVISSISYPNSKAAHLVAMARKLVRDYGSEIPSDVRLLQTLPGVGQKTASVVASVAFGQDYIAVDTHVFRVSHRLGLSDAATPEKTQAELEKGFPKRLHAKAHHWLLLHGRYTCTARNPGCGQCPISKYCAYYEILTSQIEP